MKKYLTILLFVPIIAACGGTIGDSIDTSTPTNINNSIFDDQLETNFDTDKFYRNDLKISMPDPQVYVEEDTGMMYLVGTTDRSGSNDLDMYRSDNLNDWMCRQSIIDKTGDCWFDKTRPLFFAPELYKFDDTYYLYYSAIDSTERRYISVATCDTIDGKFVDLGTDKAVFYQTAGIHNYDVLDQSIFVDDDGQMYMYYSVYKTGNMQDIYGVKMTSPTECDWSTLKRLVIPGGRDVNDLFETLQWEAYSQFKVTEGPFMIKSPKNGKYYLTYSVNHYDEQNYSICYAVADTPLGDFKKPFVNTKVLWSNLLFGFAGFNNSGKASQQWNGFMSGTGHHAFFRVGDEYMIVYHAHKQRKVAGSCARAVAFDHLSWDKDGTPVAHAPTYSVNPLPGFITGYYNVTSKAKTASKGITHPERLTDNYFLNNSNLGQLADTEATLATNGLSYFKLTLDKPYEIGSLMIYQSSFFDKVMDDPIEWIKFDDVSISGVRYNQAYLNQTEEFVRPGSGYVVDLLERVVTKTITICFRNSYATPVCLNEIEVYGK